MLALRQSLIHGYAVSCIPTPRSFRGLNETSFTHLFRLLINNKKIGCNMELSIFTPWPPASGFPRTGRQFCYLINNKRKSTGCNMGFTCKSQITPIPRPRTRRATFIATGVNQTFRWLIGLGCISHPATVIRQMALVVVGATLITQVLVIRVAPSRDLATRVNTCL